MIIASIFICQQVLVRLAKFELFMIGEDPGASAGIYSVIFPFIVLLSMLVYDIVKLKKPHRISVIGIISYVAYIAAVGVLGGSPAIELLESLR